IWNEPIENKHGSIRQLGLIVQYLRNGHLVIGFSNDLFMLKRRGQREVQKFPSAVASHPIPLVAIFANQTLMDAMIGRPMFARTKVLLVSGERHVSIIYCIVL